MDDILVKSVKATEHLIDMDEMFGVFKRHKMRLNLVECALRVSTKKFIGFMMNQRGIEVNPDKFKAIMEMTLPSKVKNVQKLTERIVALNQFFEGHIKVLAIFQNFYGS